MAIRFTPQGCKVETVYEIQPNGSYWERITLSVDPASTLALAMDPPKAMTLDQLAVAKPIFPGREFRRWPR